CFQAEDGIRDRNVTGVQTCALPISRIEKVLNKQEGIKQATVNLTNESAQIEYNPEMVQESDLIGKIQKLGYDAQPKASKEEKLTHKEKEIKQMQRKLLISAL